MNKQSSYSKYQKDIIKKLTKELGVNIPFTYEKTAKNHLKVLIDGLNKPWYTSSTPSDRKSGVNFMGDIKRALKEINIEVLTVSVSPVLTNNKLKKAIYCDKLAAHCIKSLRSRIPTLKTKEKRLVNTEQTANIVKQHRLDVINNTIAFTLSSKQFPQYLTVKEKKGVCDVIRKHLDFMMPSAADYAKDLKVSLTQVDNNNDLSQDVISGTPAVTKELATVSNISKESNVGAVKKDVFQTSANGKNISSIDWLGKQSNGKQIKTLQGLSNSEAQRLIDNLHKAIELNRRLAINEVLALMQARGVSIDDLNEKLAEVA